MDSIAVLNKNVLTHLKPAHAAHSHTCIHDLIYQGCWDRCLLVCCEVKVHICVPKGKRVALLRVALGSLGVNILINGSLSLGTPHLLEYFSWYLAQVLNSFFLFIYRRCRQVLTSLIGDDHGPLWGNEQRHLRYLPKYHPLKATVGMGGCRDVTVWVSQG